MSPINHSVTHEKLTDSVVVLRRVVHDLFYQCALPDAREKRRAGRPAGHLIYFFFAFAAAFFAFGAALPAAATFKAAPAENLGTFLAAILISLPV